jgi:hypothetical protein
MSNKLDNTRVVTFKEDYSGKNGKVIYKANSTHFIHFKTVEKLEAKKVKMDVKSFDEKKEIAKAKESFEKSKQDAK